MSKKPGLYANIHAKRKRGEKMRKPGEEGAPSAKDFKDSAKTAKKKKGVKRQDPKGNPAGYYDKDGCKKCGKEDMGRKGPYADGYGKKCDAVAEELSGLLINDDEEERADKPCGNSHIPQNAKCTKGAGQAKKASSPKGRVNQTTVSGAKKGAVLGGLYGAAVGAATGGLKGALKGAAIGGGAGAAGGAVMGRSVGSTKELYKAANRRKTMNREIDKVKSEYKKAYSKGKASGLTRKQMHELDMKYARKLQSALYG